MKVHGIIPRTVLVMKHRTNFAMYVNFQISKEWLKNNFQEKNNYLKIAIWI